MQDDLTIHHVLGPFREPLEQAFSYDYTVQRSTWPTPHMIRIKISIDQELEYLKTTILTLPATGTSGQQLLTTQLLCRALADQKLALCNQEGLFATRGDVLIGPFSDDLGYLHDRLIVWMNEAKDQLREKIKERAGI